MNQGHEHNHSGRTVSRETSLAAPTIRIRTLSDVIFSIVSQYAPVVVQAIRSVLLRSPRRAYHDLNTDGGTGHQIDSPHPVCPHRICKRPYIVLVADRTWCEAYHKLFSACHPPMILQRAVVRHAT
jgi:hypothetical protein